MKFHKMVGTEVKPHIRPEKPVDNLKFTAYKKIANSFEQAEKLIKDKAPVLGEPIVVPFYYPSSEDENKTIELAFGRWSGRAWASWRSGFLRRTSVCPLWRSRRQWRNRRESESGLLVS